MGMETARHGSADRIRIAQLTGIASRHAALKTGGGYDQAKAVAELRAVSTDPHLLAHAIPGSKQWQYRTIKAMLVAAGAEVEEVEALAAAADGRAAQMRFPVGELPAEEGQDERGS